MKKSKQAGARETSGLCAAVLIGAVALGALAGSLLARWGTVEHLSGYLSSYVTAAAEGRLDTSLPALAMRFFQLPVLVTALGLTGLGVVGIPITLGWKSFGTSYAVGCFLRLYGQQGLTLGAVLFGVTGIFLFPGLAALALEGLQVSAGLVARLGTGKPQSSFGSFWRSVGLAFALAALCIPLEKWVVAPLFLAVMK